MSTFARGNYKVMKDCGGFSVPVTFMPPSSNGLGYWIFIPAMAGSNPPGGNTEFL